MHINAHIIMATLNSARLRVQLTLKHRRHLKFNFTLFGMSRSSATGWNFEEGFVAQVYQ